MLYYIGQIIYKINKFLIKNLFIYFYLPKLKNGRYFKNKL